MKDKLDQIWFCRTCSYRGRLGEFKFGSKFSFICPKCDHDNTFPDDDDDD